LNDLGRLIARERALLHTVNRLNYVNDRKQFPAIADEEIVAPVSSSASRAPARRSCTTSWPRIRHTRAADVGDHVPSPPPDAATFESDPRIALCAAILPNAETETERDRRFKAMHPMGGRSHRSA